jgi:hypothetical protein
MSRNITGHVITACDLALHKFVGLVEELYGIENITYNVHLLTHLTTSVERWGPLWAHSVHWSRLLAVSNKPACKYFARITSTT